MDAYTPDFSLKVEGVKGFCPAGEAFAKRAMADRKIPVLACEGPCIRGEIARQAANLVTQELPSHARACFAETFFVPHSSMARWVKEADKSVVIDGCFLKCNGRALKGLVAEGSMIDIDALPLYKKYTDVFLMDDVPEEERKAVARQVADQIIVKLKAENFPNAENPPAEGNHASAWPWSLPVVGRLASYAISWRMWARNWKRKRAKKRASPAAVGAAE